MSLKRLTAVYEKLLSAYLEELAEQVFEGANVRAKFRNVVSKCSC
jgi:hypothetical protein